MYERQEVTRRWSACGGRSSVAGKYLVPQALWRRIRCAHTLRRFVLHAALRQRIRMCSYSCVLTAAQMLRETAVPALSVGGSWARRHQPEQPACNRRACHAAQQRSAHTGRSCTHKEAYLSKEEGTEALCSHLGVRNFFLRAPEVLKALAHGAPVLSSL